MSTTTSTRHSIAGKAVIREAPNRQPEPGAPDPAVLQGSLRGRDRSITALSRARRRASSLAARATASLTGVRAVSRLTVAVTARPALRRAALAAAGTGAAAAMTLGPSTPSFAATIPIVNTTNQAGYLVGGNHYQFQKVSAVITLPPNGCSGDPNGRYNYRSSGVQLIGGGTMPGKSAAVGVECRHQVDSFGWFLGFATGYLGNTFPGLSSTGVQLHDGDQIQLTISYDQGANSVHITAVKLAFDRVSNQTLWSSPPLSTGQAPGKAGYLQAVLGADVANPLPHPPHPGISPTLVRFTDCYVVTYAGISGIGIKPPPNASWGVQQQVESFPGGNLVAAPTGLTTVLPPAPQPVTSEFDIKVYGNGPIGS
jgi:hypothetical protein